MPGVNWSSAKFESAWRGTLSVLVARGRAQVGVRSAKTDWAFRTWTMTTIFSPPPPPKHTLAHGSNTLCVSCRGLAGWPGRLPQPYPHACSPSSPSRQASLGCRSRGRVGLEPHPPHTAATPTAAKAGLHSPRYDPLAGQSRVKTPPPRPLPHREVAVGMSYSLLWPPSEPTFSQTGSLGNVGGNRIPAMAHANRTTFGQAPECTT